MMSEQPNPRVTMHKEFGRLQWGRAVLPRWGVGVGSGGGWGGAIYTQVTMFPLGNHSKGSLLLSEARLLGVA